MNTTEKKQINHYTSSIDVYQDSTYWKTMYEELEEQMKQMMIMSLDLSESGSGPISDDLGQLQKNFKKQEKELKRYKQFEHRIKVTWIGKIALLYIAFKKTLKNTLKR
ncbi:hypothetical protein [Bacillus sp. UMB0893]|uniref:hypothetical protein n=1 Tax=Bacillus sp. UMB0893 TaxID=2066053 RepID=UPI000C781D0C|nr:hypothetical protein [Bacillus sp. UMB0893]PLR67949.1 hypothetical protein CYJ36_11580 [Bacillus sp. UMB0893]